MLSAPCVQHVRRALFGTEYATFCEPLGHLMFHIVGGRQLRAQGARTCSTARILPYEVQTYAGACLSRHAGMTKASCATFRPVIASLPGVRRDIRDRTPFADSR